MLENFSEKFQQIVKSESWQQVEDLFKKSKNILIFGIKNGGNLAIADHAAIDITRLTDKNAIAPGSGITATSVIGDRDAHQSGLRHFWLEYRLRGFNLNDCMIIVYLLLEIKMPIVGLKNG